MNDIRFGVRQLLKNPAFTIIAVVTLALGIGANTAIFSVVNAVLLKPLPFPKPQQLVAVGMVRADQKDKSELNSLSYPDFFDFRDQNRSFSELAVYRDRVFALTASEGAKRTRGLKASADLFALLRVEPAIGRGFLREDERAGGGPGGFKLVLSYEFWQKQFGGDRNIVGRSISLDQQPYTVIGVMPAGFQFPFESDPVDLYVTIADDAANPDGSKPTTEQRGNHSLKAVGRLKPGVTIAQAQSDLSAIAAELEKKFPDSNTGFGVGVKPLREELVGDVREALYILFGAVVCVLLIANANVANLLLARASVRGKEIAVRAAIGASRARIIRQLLTESILLAGLGGFFGLLLAEWTTGALVEAIPKNIPRIGTIELDAPVLLFTIGVSLITGIIFGIVPAWQASHIDLNTSLKSGARAGGVGAHKAGMRNALVVGEVALALVLLVCAGLLIQSFARLGRVPTGMQTERLLTASVALPSAGYPQNENVIAFFDRLLPQLRALPGVEAASTIVPLPLSGSDMSTSFDNKEHPMPAGRQPNAPVRIISTDYFKAAGIPLLRGRAFDERDRYDSPPVVIVNERFAAKYFPGENALGKTIQPSINADGKGDRVREIVGIVGNVKHLSLRDEDSPEMYLPETQIPFNTASVVVRTRVADPTSVTSAIRKELAALDPTIPLGSVHVFEEYISKSLARPRFNALLLSIFAGTALVLTAIGIYGVLAYSVAQRTNEIGIRIALGAAKSSIFRLIVGQAMALVAISVGIGLAGAFAATRLLGSLLFGVGASDPLTFAGIVLLIAAVAFIAAWLPARRAASVDPVIALRSE